MLTRDIDIAILSVPNVPVLDENGLTYRHSFFHHTVAQTFSQNSDGVTPCRGAKYRWRIKISRFFINKSLYLANDTRYRHSYYRRRIGTRMRSIKWCHFQWPWMNPNPVFKVTLLFNAKCLTNGYKGHSYYTRQIRNRTQAFEWHQLQWPWVTSKPHFKVTILFNVKSSKMVQDRALFTMPDQ